MSKPEESTTEVPVFNPVTVYRQAEEQRANALASIQQAEREYQQALMILGRQQIEAEGVLKALAPFVNPPKAEA